MQGFKGFKLDKNGKAFCQPNYSPTFFEKSRIKKVKGKPMLCINGFHFCDSLKKVFHFYQAIENHIFAEIKAIGEIDSETKKNCTNSLKVIKFLTGQEVIELIGAKPLTNKYFIDGNFYFRKKQGGYEKVQVVFSNPKKYFSYEDKKNFGVQEVKMFSYRINKERKKIALIEN